MWRSWCLVLALASSACFAPAPAAGAPCGPGEVCPSGLTCIGGLCVDGDGGDECAQQPDGTPCGSSTTSECNAPDTCAAGVCASNEAALGAACYDCAAGPAQCASCGQGACLDAACQPNGAPVAAELTSPRNTNNADEGNMFDVVAAETITITSFETHASTTGTTDYEIWTRPGTYVGSEGSSTGWTRVGTATFTAAGPGTFTPIPIPIEVTIAAGQRQAFYLTNKASNNRYHDGTQVGAVLVSTPELTLYEGAGVNYGTTGFNGINAPRAWEGKIHYRRGGGTTLATPMAGATASNGVMFNVTPAHDLQVNLLAVHLGSGTHDVDVYFRRGPYAGAESSPDQWKPLASVTGVVSAGASMPTMVPAPLGLFLESGAPTAFYVSTAASAQVRTQAPGPGPAAKNADLTITDGVTITGVFGPPGGNAMPNVELGYGSCN